MKYGWFTMLFAALLVAGCAKQEAAAPKAVEKTADKAPQAPAAAEPDKGGAAKVAEEPAAEDHTGHAHAAEPAAAAPAAAGDAPVEVTAAGTNFNPAVEKARIPAGAWFCDMGTVHYARSEAGDGTCPLCKMKLQQK